MEKRVIIACGEPRKGPFRNPLGARFGRGQRWLFGLGLVALAMTGCKQKESERKPTQPVFLVSPQGREKLQQTLLNELLANGRLRCPRPVLRSTAQPGRADSLIRSLVEPAGAIARCLGYAERHWADFRRTFFREPTQLPGGVAGRALPQVRSLVPPKGASQESYPEPAIVKELRRRCVSVAPALEKAVQRAEACSPYLPGRRRAPKLGTVLQLHLVMVALARYRFRTSPREAAWLLLHTLRWGQDLCRGGTAWIWPLVARLGALDVVATLGRVLASDGLSTAALKEVRTAVRILRASEPSLAAHLRGERQISQLERYLIPMMPLQWIPPGGRLLGAPKSRTGRRQADRRARRLRSVSGSIRQDLLVAWIASGRYFRRLASACPQGASGWQCLKGVREVEKRVVVRRGQIRERWQEFNRRAAKLKKGFDRRAAKEAAIELLVGANAPDTSGYLLQGAQRAFYLAAVRLHVLVLLSAKAQGWPSLDAIMSWPNSRRDPFNGAPLRIAAHGTGFEVRPAVSLIARPGGAPVRYVIPGPKVVSPSPAKPGKSGRGGSGGPAAPRPRTK